MGKRLFGTDGIRGVAGEYPLDPATVYTVGRCLAQQIGRRPEAPAQPRVLLGMDTRRSSPEIAAQIAAGLTEAGAGVTSAGVIPTAGVACLTASGGYDAGVMISASHNPYTDNGIKIFGPSGLKLPDAEEEQLERAMLENAAAAFSADGGPPAEDFTLPDLYLQHLLDGRDVLANHSRVTLVADCANGAASPHAWRFFGELGVKARIIGDQPNGANINHDCGSLHLDALRDQVLFLRADLGVAFDGDADRAIFIADDGSVVDGDGILLQCALYLKRRGRLANDLVVTTVMANMGLEIALQEEGVRVLRTPVGDKYVLEKMIETGATLGGEQSGHIIFREFATTGDGLLTARMMLEVLAESRQPLSFMQRRLQVYPQKLTNLPVRRKPPINEVPALAAEIAACEQELAGRGRVLVRYSGTEPLLRIMVEAEDLAEVERYCARLSERVMTELGG